MKDLIIIGAGGMGREIFYHAQECPGFGTAYEIKGFIDDDIHSLDGFVGFPEVLDTVDNYNICENDVFVTSIGSVKSKKLCVEKIIKKGGSFISLIHPTARIEVDTTLGKGNIIMRRVEIGSYAQIGDYNFIQAGAVIGHDASIGNFIRIDCKVVCVGGVVVKDEATIHTLAVISHGVTVGKRAVVGALSFVIRNIKDETTVVGNPALRLR
ncbi:MAG: acetyltransferase [Paludibacter sp.]|nr:acetyltransferase [Paludibacter sp.]